MITIEISEETETIEDMVSCLQEIIRLLEDGYKNGYEPCFSIDGEEE